MEEIHLKDSGRFALKAGANGIMTGGYLTKTGNESHKDILMINRLVSKYSFIEQELAI